jgi:hypothetical protein
MRTLVSRRTLRTKRCPSRASIQRSGSTNSGTDGRTGNTGQAERSGWRVTFQGQQAAAWPLTGKEPPHHLLGMVALRKLLRVIVIIVYADDVGRHAFPAVIPDHRPGRVKRFGQVVQRLHILALLAIVW